MDSTEILGLAGELSSGEITIEDFMLRLSGGSPQSSPTTVDLDRLRRCGFPEVIYGPGKALADLFTIIDQLIAAGQNVFATRLDPACSAELAKRYPAATVNHLARTFRLDTAPRPPVIGKVAVITAGTTDQPVAEEACETLAWMGIRFVEVQDVGVAGPHRLPDRLAEFQNADAIVVVAGMEGALPSIVGGYVACPVFGVPTSVGYGANFGGISALLSMLNSCANNVAVVNINAGFRGAYLAGLVARRMHDQSGASLE